MRLSEIGVSYSDLPRTLPRRYAAAGRIRSRFLVALYQRGLERYSHTLSGKEATTLRFRNYVVEREAQRFLARLFGFAL